MYRHVLASTVAMLQHRADEQEAVAATRSSEPRRAEIELAKREAQLFATVYLHHLS
jgi:hypothetical protein